MYIKRVVIEGFKSYRDKTSIGPFDQHFNAITGYNGSGKSNILDAICFVLGLNSLSTVRANCLSDLINNGTGVTRACVSIVFDNLDKRPGKFPLGTEHYDELIVSRSIENGQLCKYYINGILSKKKDISDMLGSVQLNINQPNFVIMQGKITQVVNMKPKEILLMIEETVGATVYQAKRDKTQKELIDKERDRGNIETMMQEVIMPSLNKQKKAAGDIEEFNLLGIELSDRKRAYNIHVYKEKKVELERRNNALEEILSADHTDEAKQKSYENVIEECEAREKERLEERQTNNLNLNTEEAEKEMKIYKKKMREAEAELNSAQKDETESRENMKEKTEARDEEKKQMNQFQNKGKSLIEEFNKVKQEIDSAEKNLEDARKLEIELKMGAIVDEFGNAMNAFKQQQDVDEKIMRLQTNIEMNGVDQKRLAERLKVAEDQLRNAPAAHNDIEKRYKAALTTIEDFKRVAATENYELESKKDFQRLFGELDEKLNGLEKRKQGILRQYPEMNFYYKDNAGRVDPEKVKGHVFNLIKFKDIETWGTAFEVAAKAFLLHIVVDESSIAKYFVEPGVLPSRTTIHPMDKFRSERQNNFTQALLDSKLGRGVALRLLDFLEYDPKYHDLVQSHIGHKVLVETSETARKVAFGHHFFSISKNGDSVDPDGIMQGGARKNGGAWIKAADELRQLNEEIGHVKREQQSLKKERDLYSNYSKARCELDTTTYLRSQTPRFIALAEIVEIKRKDDSISEQNKLWKKEKEDLEKEASNLKSKVDNLESIRAKNYEENISNIKKYEKALESAQKKFNARQAVYAKIDIDIKAREQFLLDCQTDVDNAESELQDCIKETKCKMDAYTFAKEAFLVKEKVYLAAEGENKRWAAEKQELENRIAKAKKMLHEAEIRKIQRDSERKELMSAVKSIQKKVEEVVASCPEVNFDELPLGPVRQEHSKKLKEELDFLESRIDAMKQRLDFEGAEKMKATKLKVEATEVKLQQLTLNRNKLTDALKQLDKHKMDLVTAAYDKINKEFDGMMSTLLPDCHARLVPVTENDLTNGLLIHVNIGGVWKESLTELSGGQRSLVALALVLSLCMYSPAPFYVLDEVDAALDMNHTQNIGVLIKTRFKDTQFVCVSLKEGMYTNARVVFQTSFLNGKSEVRRCSKKRKSVADRRASDESEADHRRP